jgi:hypothetical protein
MKTICTLTFTCFAFLAHAQDLDWACTASNISYRFLINGADGDMLVGAVRSENQNTESYSQIFQEDGTEVENTWNDRIISYSRTGQINWIYSLEASQMKLAGLSLDAQNRITLLVLDERERVQEETYEGEEGESEQQERQPPAEEEDGPGYYLFYLDQTGTLTETVYCSKMSAGLEVHDFKMHPKHGFVLSGYAQTGLIAENIPGSRVGANGGNVILAVSGKGEPVWADVITFRSSELGGDSHLSVAKDGTVYFAGSYYQGISYGKGQFRKLAPKSYQEVLSGYDTSVEVFVACYNTDGTFSWLKTPSNRSDLGALHASDKGVYLAYRILGGDDTTFDRAIDMGDKVSVVTFLNKNGAFEWSFPIGGEIKNLGIGKEDSFFVLGACRMQPETLLVSNDPNPAFKQNDNFFLARFTGKQLNWIETADILAETEREPFLLLPDPTHNHYYISGSIFCRGIPLNYMDEAFKRGECEFSTSFIAKLKMN